MQYRGLGRLELAGERQARCGGVSGYRMCLRPSMQ
ncbi:MAG: hypothetical protein QOI16_1599 [Pseudonocardiales bacterium]|jgi:hypothetical protein|nr:hypothetical protein [Pseudonocardiales bacterium]